MPPRAAKARASSSRRLRSSKPADAWDGVARVFHEATRDAAWATPEQADQIDATQKRRALTDPPPSSFKAYRGRGVILPSPHRGAFADVLRARRTWRGFGRAPVTIKQLATLLHLTFGPQMLGRTNAGARVMFKTSPSAGARHPTEAYVLAVRVRGIAPGLYHFSPKTGRLHLVRRGASADQLVGYLSGQWWYRDAAALVLMTSVLPRVRWRYPHPRAYRSILLDAGHVCQTFCLVATWLKLAPFCTQALADSEVERDLGVDGVDEVVIYAAGVGTRPRGGQWVQWPEHLPGHPSLPPAPGARR